LRIAKTSKPGSFTEPKPGVFVFDMGRDIVGWCQLKVQGPALTQIILRHAEKLKTDGMLDLTESNGVKATDSYVLRGDGLEICEPRFTCHKFRYVEVTGYPGKPTSDAISVRVLTKLPEGL
jgi:alpha-L-rhamnosidase